MDTWLFTNSHLCQFIEIVHKIINWYMKNVGLKVCVCVGGGGGGGGHKHTIAPRIKKVGGT